MVYYVDPARARQYILLGWTEPGWSSPQVRVTIAGQVTKPRMVEDMDTAYAILKSHWRIVE